MSRSATPSGVRGPEKTNLRTSLTWARSSFYREESTRTATIHSDKKKEQDKRRHVKEQAAGKFESNGEEREMHERLKEEEEKLRQDRGGRG